MADTWTREEIEAELRDHALAFDPDPYDRYVQVRAPMAGWLDGARTNYPRALLALAEQMERVAELETRLAELEARSCHGCGNDISDFPPETTRCGALECGGKRVLPVTASTWTGRAREVLTLAAKGPWSGYTSHVAAALEAAFDKGRAEVQPALDSERRAAAAMEVRLADEGEANDVAVGLRARIAALEQQLAEARRELSVAVREYEAADALDKDRIAELERAALANTTSFAACQADRAELLAQGAVMREAERVARLEALAAKAVPIAAYYTKLAAWDGGCALPDDPRAAQRSEFVAALAALSEPTQGTGGDRE